MSEVSLKDCIAPSFYDVHRSIKAEQYTHYWFKGGRGSTKSSFISIEIILGIMKDPQANCVCFRQGAVDLADSVYSQLCWAINALGVEKYFKCLKSPMTIIYQPTGQRVYFRGLDDPTKVKSIRTKTGYMKYAWFEEVSQMDGMETIRNICQSVIRGGDKFFIFYSFNPPKSAKSWVNKELAVKKDNRFIHHSDYTTVPRHWLGEEFFIEAEMLKKNDFAAYEHELLGVSNGTFDNLVVQRWSADNEHSITYQPDMDLHITCDFNYSPNCWILAHKTDDKVFYFKEYCIDMRTEDLIKCVLDDYPHGGRIVINGDASGGRFTSNSKHSDYDHIRNALIERGYRPEGDDCQTGKRFVFHLPFANGSRKARFDAWNAKVRNSYTGEVSIYIDPIKCPQLLMNMTELQVIPGTSDFATPTKTELIRNPDLRFLGHPFDAAGYLVNFYWGIKPVYKDYSVKAKVYQAKERFES